MPLERTTAPTDEPIHLTEAKNHLRVDVSDHDDLIEHLITAAREEAEGFMNRAILTQSWRYSLDAWVPVIRLPIPPLRSVESIKYLDTAGVEQTWSANEYRVDADSEPARITTDYGETYPALRGVINAVKVNYIAGYATPFTVDANTNTLTAVGHPYSNGDVVRVSHSGGALPGGLSKHTDYYVISVSGDDLQLSASEGGSAIDITSAGTGTHYLGLVPEPIRSAIKLTLGHLFAHRESVTAGVTAGELPLAARWLLTPYRTVMF